MHHVISGGLVAAALGTALIVAGAFPASAQAAPASGNSDSNLLTLVRGGGGGHGGGGGRHGGGGGHMGGGGHFGGGHFGGGQFRGGHFGDGRSRIVVRGNRFFGFGDGGYGYGDYGYGAHAYGGGYDDALAYCMSRFRTYDLSTRTYIGYDGRAHACP
jgi:hypothetical protein